MHKETTAILGLLLTSGSGWLPGSEVGVLTECENVWTRIFMIAQTTANELLGTDKMHLSK